MAVGSSILWLAAALGVLDYSRCYASAVLPRDAVPAGFVAPPYYPAPHGGWTASWADSYAKAKALVEQMTLAEKTNITGGVGIYMGRSLSEPRRPVLHAGKESYYCLNKC